MELLDQVYLSIHIKKDAMTMYIIIPQKLKISWVLDRCLVDLQSISSNSNLYLKSFNSLLVDILKSGLNRTRTRQKVERMSVGFFEFLIPRDAVGIILLESCNSSALENLWKITLFWILLRALAGFIRVLTAIGSSPLKMKRAV